MKVTDKKLAAFANLPVGTWLSTEEGKDLLHRYHAHVDELEQARFDGAAKTAPNFSRIVTKTWSRNGKSLHRGEVVYVKKGCDASGSCMVTRSKSRSAQGFIWTCGWNEIEEHSVLAISAKKEA